MQRTGRPPKQMLLGAGFPLFSFLGDGHNIQCATKKPSKLAGGVSWRLEGILRGNGCHMRSAGKGQAEREGLPLSGSAERDHSLSPFFVSSKDLQRN